jgi:hypothetical protein
VAGRRLAGVAACLVVAAIATAAACTHDRPAPTAATEPDPLAPLRAYEEARRSQTHFLDAPASDRTLGADPYDLVALPGGAAGILRGRDAVVLVDGALAEKARAKAPRSGPS